MIIYNRASEAKAEFKAALALAAIIVLVAITFLCSAVAVSSGIATTKRSVTAQLVLRADSR